MFQQEPGYAQYGPMFTFLKRLIMAVVAAAVLAAVAAAGLLVAALAL